MIDRIGGKLVSHPQRNNPRQRACQCPVITMSMVCNQEDYFERTLAMTQGKAAHRLADDPIPMALNWAN
jgi:hypothetical protein